MRFRVRRSSLGRDARFTFSFLQISLLDKNAGEIQPGHYKVRSEPQRGLEMTYSGSDVSLLRQHPAEGGLRLGIPGRATNCLFEIAAGGGKVALLERLLTMPVGKTGC